MANRDMREALRGVEDQAFDLIFEAYTPEKWADLLQAPLVVAATQGKTGLVHKLVGAGAELGRALHAAVRNGQTGVLRCLLDSGASLGCMSAYNSSPLHLAARLGHAEIVKLLVLEGADTEADDDDGHTPLSAAVSNGHLAATQAFFDTGVKVGSNALRTAILAAAQQGDTKILSFLSERGANVDIDKMSDTTQCRPLHIAAEYSNVAAIDLLVFEGADIEAGDLHGAPPLHWAAMGLRHESLIALLRHGANVNASDELGFTALHHAASYAGTRGAAELVVDTLLRSNADETITNTDGISPQDAVGNKAVGRGRVDDDDLERVRKLLANAPADRAWRRRGYLVLCRARSDRLQLSQAIGDIHGGKSTRLSEGIPLRTGGSGRIKEPPLGGSSTADQRDLHDKPDAIPKVVGLQEEGIFRRIVSFL
ncbi:unnamed protein product [Scytosiphon promiscuus]